MEQEKLIQTLLECAELIKIESNLFDYGSVDFPTCDTPGCIAGWVASIAVSRGDAIRDECGMFSMGDDDFSSAMYLAESYLGLTEAEALELFLRLFTYTDTNHDLGANPTREQAVEYIERFIRYIERGRRPEDLEVFSNAQVHFD